jgi:transposase
MFSLTPSMRYYLYSCPTDMRRSFYTLSGMVTNQMGRNVQDGDVFIFINRTCTVMKVLHMECGGLAIYHLRLESGTFTLPEFDPGNHTFKTSWQGLMAMTGSLAKEKHAPGNPLQTHPESLLK